MSPYRLLQEHVDRDQHYPWRVLVSCALLNRTTGTAAHKAAGELFGLWPDPVHWRFDFLAEKYDGTGSRQWQTVMDRCLGEVLQPLGLVNRRTELLHRMTADYLAGISPYDCRGAGRYACDALDVFCVGELLRDPADHYLKAYVEWRRYARAERIEWDEVGHIEWLAGRRGHAAVEPHGPTPGA